MRAHALASLSVMAALAACQSLTVVDKTPDRKALSAIILAELRCFEEEAVDGGEAAEKCDPQAQPKEVHLTEVACEAAPLQPGVNAAARASCAYQGELVRTDGVREPIVLTHRDFLLIDMTPGLRVPVREWSPAKPLRRKPVEKASAPEEAPVAPPPQD